MTGKRSKLITIAGAGTLTLAAAASAAATLSAGSAAPGASTAYAHLPAVSHQQATRSATPNRADSGQVRFSPAQRQYAHELALRNAAVHKATVAHAAHEAHLQLVAAQAAAATAKASAQQTTQPQATAPATAPAQQAAPSAPSGTPRQIAEAMLSQFGWSSSQFSCLDPLWAQESGWSVTAQASSGAYGIPQALPGSKMASAGADWQTDATTQIRWGLQYIQGTYGSPCAAWSHEQADGWY